MSKELEGVTIIICCYNSVKRLPETIRHISLQKNTEDIPWEILLIDNASTDNTSEVANNLCEQYLKHVPFSIIYEDNPGLASARKRGINEAKHEFLLFCDDDNWLYPDYVAIGFHLLKNNSKIGVLGGQGVGEYESHPPQWFLDHTMNFAIGKQANASGNLTSTRGWVFGAGFFNRKSLLKQLEASNFIFLLTGRKGNVLSTGEDKELCFVIREMGYQIFYDEKLMFKHYMPVERFNYDKFVNMAYYSGRASFVYNLYDNALLAKSFPLYWLYNVADGMVRISISWLLKSILFNSQSDFKVKNDMRFKYQSGRLPILFNIGYCIHCINIKTGLIANLKKNT